MSRTGERKREQEERTDLKSVTEREKMPKSFWDDEKESLKWARQGQR